jgi:ferritin-like metal-binding protein YciE
VADLDPLAGSTSAAPAGEQSDRALPETSRKPSQGAKRRTAPKEKPSELPVTGATDEDVQAAREWLRESEGEMQKTLERARQILRELEQYRQRAEESGREGAKGARAPQKALPPLPSPQTPPPLPKDAFPLPPVNEIEAAAKDEADDVIQATVRAESPAERLGRHLNEAWVLEDSLLDALHDMSEEVIEPNLRAKLNEHRQVTQRQKEALEARIKELGKEPTGKRGVLKRVFDSFNDMWKREPDDYDRTMHNLQKAIATEHFEMAMYQSLGALAEAAGDTTTAELAARHLREEREAADALWPFLRSLGKLAPDIVAVTEPVESGITLDDALNGGA